MFTFHSLEGQLSCEHLEFSGTHKTCFSNAASIAHTRFLRHGCVVVQHYLCSQVLIHTVKEHPPELGPTSPHLSKSSEKSAT